MRYIGNLHKYGLFPIKVAQEGAGVKFCTVLHPWAYKNYTPAR
jgi:hypothetical protein